MSPNPIAILATGMVTGVGLDAPSSCAAIRCAYDNVQETRFMDKGGEWVMGSEVPLEGKLWGREKLLAMASMAIQECMAGLQEAPQPITADQIPLLLCVAEEDRPGRLANLDGRFLQDLQALLGHRFHPASYLIPKGRVGGVEALRLATELLRNPEFPRVIIVGVDSYLNPATLVSFESQFRLKTSENSDGFIPGEAAAAVLLGRKSSQSTAKELLCLGTGQGAEPAPIHSGEPLRGDGLVQAIWEALGQASLKLSDLDFRMADLSGENYGFKEATLALSRTLRELKEEFDIWLPAECLGETGAAVVPCMIGIAQASFRKRYTPGDGLLCHVANDHHERAAAVLKFQ